MTITQRSTTLISSKPFTVDFISKRSLFFCRGSYEVCFKGQKYGTLSNDPELAKLADNFLNGAYRCGAGSGLAYAQFESNPDKTPGFKAYTLEVYKGKDTSYDFTINFEDTPIQNIGGISAAGLNNLVGALNAAHSLGFSAGVDLVLLERKEQAKASIFNPAPPDNFSM